MQQARPMFFIKQGNNAAENANHPKAQLRAINSQPWLLIAGLALI
jgi:hypothetical protein